MLENNGPGYHPKFALAVVIALVVLALVAAVAMLYTIPPDDCRADFPGLHEKTDSSSGPSRGLSGSDVRDVLKRARLLWRRG